MSHGIEPARTAPRMASAFALTSSNEQRSNAAIIASRSDSRNSGLISLSNVGAVASVTSLSCSARATGYWSERGEGMPRHGERASPIIGDPGGDLIGPSQARETAVSSVRGDEWKYK